MKNAPKNKTVEDFFDLADVHALRRETHGGLMSAVVACVVFLVECLLVYWAVRQNLSLPFVLLLHTVVVVLLAIYARLLLDSGRENRFALLLLITTATTGPFGAAGTVLCVLLVLWFTRRSQPFDSWFDSIFPAISTSRSQRIYDDIVVGRDESARDYSVISFLDVVSFGSEMQKRQALAKMTSNFHPNFAPAFRKALSDSSNTIRVQAATAVTKIENAFMERLIKLSRVKEKFPKEPVVVMALAEHYDNYAYTGLLDADRETANRRKALEHYHEYLELQPHDGDVRTRIGRILMRNKDYEKACAWLKQTIDLGYGSESVSQWYSEALFACGRFGDLRRFSQSRAASGSMASAPQPLALKEALMLWANATAGGRP